MSPEDSASEEMRIAWANVYGRHPNPSDAWDHAIKAVEEIYRPLVVPKQTKGTLSDVVGQLKNTPHVWHFELGRIEALEAAMRLMWPNPDRHGGGDKRVPTMQEAEAVVQLAVMLVQWGRTGLLRKM